MMGSRLFVRGWLVSALTLALGVPASVFAGIAIAFGLGMTVGRLLPEWAMTFIWLFGSTIACGGLWLMVRRRVSRGGWRTLVLGLSGASAIALGSYVLGALTPTGDNMMAGTAWVAFGYICGVGVLLAILMGVLATRIEAVRSAHEPGAAGQASTSS